VRDYVVVRNDSGGTDIGCHFIPDDGSRPFPLVWPNATEGSAPFVYIGEFARGAITGNGDDRRLVVKLPPEMMAKAEELFARINAMEPVRRAMMQRMLESLGSFLQKHGYGRDRSWRLVKAAPGLLRE
jgi:hypothetical protein